MPYCSHCFGGAILKRETRTSPGMESPAHCRRHSSLFCRWCKTAPNPSPNQPSGLTRTNSIGTDASALARIHCRTAAALASLQSLPAASITVAAVSTARRTSGRSSCSSARAASSWAPVMSAVERSVPAANGPRARRRRSLMAPGTFELSHPGAGPRPGEDLRPSNTSSMCVASLTMPICRCRSHARHCRASQPAHGSPVGCAPAAGEPSPKPSETSSRRRPPMGGLHSNHCPERSAARQLRRKDRSRDLTANVS
mmetsp:Transcript_622/g.2179  ORF Transcript_622/g.2179 Transcript_622/m.2179 type:complete len:255 (-) Transcript_622:503-1267(-)